MDEKITSEVAKPVENVTENTGDYSEFQLISKKKNALILKYVLISLISLVGLLILIGIYYFLFTL
jgi:hypothetical protein